MGRRYATGRIGERLLVREDSELAATVTVFLYF
jgi:hypothetical protein